MCVPHGRSLASLLLAAALASFSSCDNGGCGSGPLPLPVDEARAFEGILSSFALTAGGSGDVYMTRNYRVSGSGTNGIFRLNADGTLDTAFAIGAGFNNPVHSLSPAADGSGDVYVTRYCAMTGATTNCIFRLNADGSLDTAFAIGAGFNNPVYSLSPAADGSGDVYVGGYFTSYNGTAVNRIVRLNANGTLDTAFAIGTGFEYPVYSISPAADGSGDVYVGGLFKSYNGTAANGIVRLNADGTLDTAFAIGTGFNGGSVLSIAPAADGSGDVYVGGYFTSYNGTAVNRIVRLNANGSLDTAFASGAGFNNPVYSLSPAADASGDVYVGGLFRSYNGTAANGIVRLNANGSLDTAFASGSGFNDVVLSIAPAADGSGDVYVGGGFTTYNGTAANGIVRLNADGTLDTAFATDKRVR